MPIRSAVISVGSNPISLSSNSRGSAAAVTVFNMGGAGSGIVYLGDSQVSATTGLPIASNSTPIRTVGSPYGISNSGVQVVRILEEY